VTVLPKEYEDYDFISKKAEGLSDLVFHYETVIFEDSVQMIAAMDEKTRMKFLEKTRQDILDEEARKKAEAERRLLEQQKRVNTQTSSSQTGSKWYFYNTKVKGSGFNDYRALWGQRIMEDNWRRTNKTSYAHFDENSDEFSDSINPAEIDIVSFLINLKKILAPHLLQKPLFAFLEDLNHLSVFLEINFKFFSKALVYAAKFP